METVFLMLKMKICLNCNSLIYLLQRLPFVGKLFKDSLYKNKGIFVILGFIIDIFKFLGGFIKKFIYMFVFVAAPIILMIPEYKVGDIMPISYIQRNTDIALFIIFAMNFLFGPLMNAGVTKNDQDGYLYMKLIKIHPKKYLAFSTIIRRIIEMFMYIPAMIITAFLIGASVADFILVTVLMFSFRLFMESIHLAFFGKFGKSLLQYKIIMIFLNIVLYICIMSLFYNNIIPDISVYILSVPFIILSAVLGIISIIYIMNYKFYKKISSEIYVCDLLFTANEKDEKYYRKQSVEVSDKDFRISKKNNGKLKDKTGYDYLNTLFFDRNRRILLKSVRIKVILVIIAAIASLVLIFTFPEVKVWVIENVNNNLPFMVFIMYILSLGTEICMAMFANCDGPLLRYSFYKKKDVILENFKIRLKHVTSLNLFTAFSVCGAISIIFLMAGVKSIITTILIYCFTIICLSLFFSVHYLFLYYIMQPFTLNFEEKSVPYTILNTVLYVFCFYCKDIPLKMGRFSVLMIFLTVTYIIIALFLVYKLAPKKFKLRT